MKRTLQKPVTPKVEKITTKVWIALKGTSEVQALIADLKMALKKSKRNGGIHHVYRRQGNSQAAFEIQIPMSECKHIG
jgi:hypothetical protein